MEAGLPADRLSAPVGARPETGIVHFGPGAFFRAFNATFTHEAIKASGGDWSICAVSLRSARFRDQLEPQGGAFTSVELAPEGAKYQVITSIRDVLVAPEDPEAVLTCMVVPEAKIVSLTITEKGYCHEPSTGALRLDDPDIQSDLAGNPPKTAIGFIVEALARRKDAGALPFTVMSCDNLPENGRLAKGVVLAFARARDADLADWIEAEGAFPCTMVDRITPATTEADTEALQTSQGYYDPANVQHEPFRQWVIEDNFVGDERPAWDHVGAQIVSDVVAFEHMKLRCLNGTHSALAYLGYLGGYETISETVADPAYARLCEKLWATEIAPTVPQPEGEDLPAYCAALLNRYQNPSIKHRTWQIAMDGSQKLPQRILGAIAENLDAGRPVEGLSLVVAAWMRYVGGVDETGKEIDVRDPLEERLKAAFDSGETPEAKVDALLAIADVFAPDLAANARFSETVKAAFSGLIAQGAQATVGAYTA